MPSAIITTIGGSTSNSYVDVVTADAYFDDKVEAATWTGAMSDNKARALLMATQRMQSENWLGSRATTTQRLAWPRLNVHKIDGVGAGYGAGWGGYGYGWFFGDVYLSTEIPQQVKDAQCELALEFLSGFTEGGDDAMESFSADGVGIKFRGQPAGGMPSAVAQLIAGLVSGNILVRA